MNKRIDFQGFASTAGLAALFVALGGNPLAAEDTVSGGVSTEQNTDDGVSVGTDVTTSANTGDCHVSAYASASSTSNGETVVRQSEKSVVGPCGKASAKARASSSGSAKSNGD